MRLCQDENPVKPLPKGEIAIWQSVFAEEWPCENQLIDIIQILRQVIIPESFAC